MNKVHKVIWNRVKHCYVVVSEIAKNQGKDGKRNGSLLRGAVLGALLAGAFAMPAFGPAGDVWALDAGSQKITNVAEETDNSDAVNYKQLKDIKDDIAVVYDKQGSLKSTNATVSVETAKKTSTSIALGKGAVVSVDEGRKANGISFGNDTYTGGIAIGENTKAKNNSVTIGTNTYNGKIGDIDLSQYEKTTSQGVGTTTVGSNSYTWGTLATNIGTYNVTSTKYGQSGGGTFYVAQNFGSTILGTMNSIESATSSSMVAGVANSIVGVANRTQNSNGSLIFGAGNEITNSTGYITGSPNGDSVTDAAKSFRQSVKDNNGGGAVLAIGGGNKADYVKHSQLMGVNNTVTGTSGKNAEYVLVDGYNNTVTTSQHVTAIGSNNTVKGDSNKIYGDNHKVTGKNNVIIGSADEETETNVDGAVILGHNANATVAGGIAIGENSITNREIGIGNAYGIGKDTGSAWISTAGAVSIGDVDNGITRQITGVAAGSADTDAVNVAQLKKAWRDLYKHIISPVTPPVTPGEGSGSGTGSTEITPKPIDPDEGEAGESYKSDFQLVNGSAQIIDKDGNATSIQKGEKEISTGYKADANGNITMEVKDANGNTNYVAITDVASNQKLNQVETQVNDNTKSINILNGSLSRLDRRVDRVGAGAAALAALHPLDFDPDAKWDFAAGYGNYNGANAVSVGAFYRPNEDLMFSVGGSMGGGENMVNAGVSVKLGSGSSHVTTSKVAMAKEIKDLRQTVETQAQQIAELAAMVRELTGKGTAAPAEGMFPDVPENHWAYEAVKDLKDRGYVTGYPDGTFKGDRTITRYEFAQIAHNALQAGAPDSEAVKKLKAEFAPELERFTVDTVAKDKDGNPTIQRVRVVKKVNG